MQDNVAIWLNADGGLDGRTVNTTPSPEDGEALVRVLFSGINPADSKHASIGIFATVSGYDFCGVVEEGGPGCPFNVGDVIAGVSPVGISRSEHFGTHQNYMIWKSGHSLAWKVPPGVPPAHAACMTVVLCTAADALFNLFGYPLPGESTASSTSALLIWGGSTSVGISTMQFAKAVGISPIIVTASPSQHDVLVGLGASKCFDYKMPDVVEAIRDYVQKSGQPLKHILDAAGIPEARTADLAASCGEADAHVLCSIAHPKFPMPFGNTMKDIHLDIPGKGPIVLPARSSDAKRARAALLWAANNYGASFQLPRVQVVVGKVQSAIAAIVDVAESKAPFGKYAIEHPLYY